MQVNAIQTASKQACMLDCMIRERGYTIDSHPIGSEEKSRNNNNTAGVPPW
jgi:hypothetical protein